MKSYSPFGKEIHALETSDLIALKETSEGWYVEYKREETSAAAIAKSISAFANTYGGWLFYGIKEASKDTPVAGEFPGIPRSQVDGTLQRIRKAAADLINPTPYFEHYTLWGPDGNLDLQNDFAIICIWIPHSQRAPHVHRNGVIYRRVADSSEPKPENDRFVLDQLWKRSDTIKEDLRKWHAGDPEFSDAEKNTPYVRLMLVCDKWLERQISLPPENDDIDDIRTVLSTQDGTISIPFDTVYTSSHGFVARQLKDNDPNNLSLTWRLGRNLKSDVIIPLNCYQTRDLEYLRSQLDGYLFVDEFNSILKRHIKSKLRVVDLNFLFNILVAIAGAQSRLCQLADWRDEYHVKIKILNAGRTIPFVDTDFVLDGYKKNGLPMLMDSNVTVPDGSKPDSFVPVGQFVEIEDYHLRSVAQACQIFYLIGLAYGFPAWIEHSDDLNAPPFYYALGDAGGRAQKNQRLRSNRLKDGNG